MVAVLFDKLYKRYSILKFVHGHCCVKIVKSHQKKKKNKHHFSNYFH